MASNEVTIVEKSVGMDLYTDETHICGTSQFADQVMDDHLASLAFTADDSALLPAQGTEFPEQGDHEEADFTPPLQGRPQLATEVKEVEQPIDESASTNPSEPEAAEDVTTTREALAKAALSLSASQVLTNQNQAEMRKRQEEMDLELQSRSRPPHCET